jgi:hypothetical protein
VERDDGRKGFDRMKERQLMMGAARVKDGSN